MSWNKSNYLMASPFHRSPWLWVQLIRLKQTLAFPAADSNPAQRLLWKRNHDCSSHVAVILLPEQKINESPQTLLGWGTSRLFWLMVKVLQNIGLSKCTHYASHFHGWHIKYIVQLTMGTISNVTEWYPLVDDYDNYVFMEPFPLYFSDLFGLLL